MTRRRMVTVAVLLVAVVATFVVPTIYWRVVGWAKHESFYQGRPTSWWVRDIRRTYAPVNTPDMPLTTYTTAEIARDPGPALQQLRLAMAGSSHVSFMREYATPWYEASVDVVVNNPRPAGVLYDGGRPPLLDGDAEGLAVLMELLVSDDVKSRQVAACGLGELGKAAQPAVALLRDGCTDNDAIVSTNARWALSRIE